MNNCYLYFHINPLFNHIFYVGIGYKYDKNNKPSRAYSKCNRNKFWHNTVKKYGYIVDIVETDLTWEDACIKEIFYIHRIGRRDLKTGTLVNMTNGGDGNINPSQETRKKIGDAQRKRKGYKMSPTAIQNQIKGKTGLKRSIASKQKMSDARIGMVFSDTHKENLSISAKLRKPTFKDKNHTTKTKEQIQEKLSGIDNSVRKCIELDIISNIDITEISNKYDILRYKIYNIKYYLKNSGKL